MPFLNPLALPQGGDHLKQSNFRLNSLAGSHLIPNHYADYRIDGLRITLPLPRRPLKTRAGLTSKSGILSSKSVDSGLHAVSAIPFAFAKSPLEVPEGRINVEIRGFEFQKHRFRPPSLESPAQQSRRSRGAYGLRISLRITDYGRITDCTD